MMFVMKYNRHDEVNSALKWTGTLSGIAGALLLASNISESPWGFVLFAVSSVCWGAAGVIMREPSLMLLHSVFLTINFIGIWRWLVP